MRLVILESPYAGDIEENIKYARAAVRDSLLRGEAPIASHLLYTQEGVLDDSKETERRHGINAGLAWRRVADASVVYVDRGISTGMQYGIAAALEAGVPVEYRKILVDET
jgi:predicted phosphoribosyltransferase